MPTLLYITWDTDDTGLMQQCLDQAGLTAAALPHQGDIADGIGCVTGHGIFPELFSETCIKLE